MGVKKMTVAKALAGAVTTLLFFLFYGEGTALQAQEALGILLTTFFVWLVPNRAS